MNKAFRFLLALIIMAVVLPAPSFHVAAQDDCDPDTDYVTVGYDAISVGDYEGALAAYDCALQLTTDPIAQADAYYGRGVANAYLGYPDQAFQDYEAAIELDPTNPYPWLGRGTLYQVNEQAYEEARADYEQALKLYPEFQEAYVQRGLLFQDTGFDDLALEDFNYAITLNPNDPYAYFYRGVSYQFLEDDERAIQDFDQALAVDENFGWAFLYRGISYQYLAQDEVAIEDFNRALAYDPNDPYVHLYRGVSYSYLGEDEKALEDFNEALNRDPENIYALIHRASTYMWLDDIDAAWADLELADSLDVHDEYPDIDLYWGLLYQAMDDDESALGMFETYLATYPEDAFALGLLGESLFYLEREEEAVEVLTQALSLADEDYDWDVIGDALFYRGVTYYYLGDYEAALEDLSGVTEFYEDDAWTYAYRSDVYYELGDYDAALEDIQYAVYLDPEEEYFVEMAEEIGIDPSELEYEGDEFEGEGDGFEEEGDDFESEGDDLEGGDDGLEDDVSVEEETTYLVPETGKSLRLKPDSRRQDARSALRSRSDDSVRSRSRGQDRGSTRGSTRVS